MDFKKLDNIKTPEEWLEPVMNPVQNNKDISGIYKNRKKWTGIRAAVVVAVICITVFCTGIAVMASASDAFLSFLKGIFGEQKVSEVELYENLATETPDIEADGNGVIGIKENTWITGERESFISEYHSEGDDLVVDCVYGVSGDGLNRLESNYFKGECDGIPFSFEYVTINREIYGFNYTGGMDEVFGYIDGGTAYAALSLEDGKGTIQKGFIVALDLKTGGVKKLSGDNMICNFVMSPYGKVILCNHRSDGYWSAFDIATGAEKKIPAINGYARTDEIEFLDDYHILTLGEPYVEGNMELYYSTYLVDLCTNKIEKEYKDSGNINLQWSYKIKKQNLEIYSITDNKYFRLRNASDGIHPLDVCGDYVLFGDLQDQDAGFYLANLLNQSYIKLDIPAELRSSVEIHIAGNEKKILVTNGSKAYLADISKL